MRNPTDYAAPVEGLRQACREESGGAVSARYQVVIAMAEVVVKRDQYCRLVEQSVVARAAMWCRKGTAVDSRKAREHCARENAGVEGPGWQVVLLPLAEPNPLAKAKATVLARVAS